MSRADENVEIVSNFLYTININARRAVERIKYSRRKGTRKKYCAVQLGKIIGCRIFYIDVNVWYAVTWIKYHTVRYS